jgi:N-acetylglucosaminyl-diphospho-decaprenol L-rhamnosyltransferase
VSSTDVLVVIVNYRSADLTVDCLRSLAPERSAVPGLRVVVTDNRSPDDSVAKLTAASANEGWADWVQLLPLEANGGFAYGNNGAIRPALATAPRPDYVLLLNPDTVVRPGGVAELVSFMDGHPAVGLAGSRLEDPDGTPQVSAFRFPSIASEFDRGVRLGIVTRLLKNRVVAPPVPTEAGPCDWVAGASLIVRPAVFDAVGLMDERYFMYFEEVDFCLAAHRAGWPCWYVPASRVVHLVGAVSQLSDSRKHRKRRPAYWFESRRRYFVKNHGRLYAAAADAAFLAGFSAYRLRRAAQRKADTDPPRMWADSVAHSVFVKGASIEN